MTSGRCACVSVVFVLALAAGCQQEQAGSEKQARLLAARNVELEERVAEQRSEMEALRKEFAAERKRYEELLAQYESRNQALQKDVEQGIAERVKSVTATVMDENARLRQQIEALKAGNERLKADVGRLQAEVQRLRSATESSPQP